MLKKLLIALTSGLLTVGIVLAGWSRWTGVPVPVLLRLDSYPTAPPFAFSAHYATVNPENPKGIRCNFGFGPTSVTWWDGPQDDLAAPDVPELARASLAWFEDSPGAQEWLSNEEARLELTYPSLDRTVTVRRARDSGLSWGAQLASWFERFPPTPVGGRAPWVAGRHSWEVDFGEQGEVSGSSPTAEEAAQAMKALVAGRESSASFGAPTFDLGMMVQSGPRSMSCYSVDTKQLDEVEALPERLLAQRGGP